MRLLQLLAVCYRLHAQLSSCLRMDMASERYLSCSTLMCSAHSLCCDLVALYQDGVRGLYEGYDSNVAYAFPADAAKFLIYQQLKRNAK